VKGGDKKLDTPLSMARVSELLRANKTRVNASGSKWFDGYDWHNGKPPAHSVGRFEGKAGKGRRYNAVGTGTVVAYKL
jgi:hypothetical protein